MITPEDAKAWVDKIESAKNDLNIVIEAAALEGVNVKVETRWENDEHFEYPAIHVFNPTIDLEWEPAGT